MKTTKFISIAFVAVLSAAIFAPMSCHAECREIGNGDGFNNDDYIMVQLITITESETDDPVVTYEVHRPTLYKYFPEQGLPQILTGEQVKEKKVQAHAIPYDPTLRDPIPTMFSDGYWSGSGLAVNGCTISEASTGTLQTLSLTKDAFPYPIAFVAYKQIVESPEHSVVWKIFPLYAPGDAVPATPDEMPIEAGSKFGVLTFERPSGAGGVKLKYMDNKFLSTTEKELTYEETWKLPFYVSEVNAPDKATPALQPGSGPGVFKSGRTLKLINHGVYLLALAPEKANDE